MILQKGQICQNAIVAREVWLGIPAPLKGTETILVVTVGEGQAQGICEESSTLQFGFCQSYHAVCWRRREHGDCRQPPKPLRRRWLGSLQRQQRQPHQMPPSGRRLSRGGEAPPLINMWTPALMAGMFAQRHMGGITVSAQPWAAIPTCYVPQWHGSSAKKRRGPVFSKVENDTHRNL